jgi:hypothetical protein
MWGVQGAFSVCCFFFCFFECVGWKNGRSLGHWLRVLGFLCVEMRLILDDGGFIVGFGRMLDGITVSYGRWEIAMGGNNQKSVHRTL